VKSLSVGSVLTFWLLGTMGLLLVTLLTGGLQPWFWWGWLGLTLGSVAVLAGPWLVQALGHSGLMSSLLLRLALAGWAVVGGILLALDTATNHAITWSLMPLVGLGAWPLFAAVVHLSLPRR
jgi:hypothetical protein